jgi:hypothetical protein
MSLPDDTDLIHVSIKLKDQLFIENDIKAIVFNYNKDILDSNNSTTFSKIIQENQLECKVFNILYVEKLCINQNILMLEMVQGV